MNKYHAHTHVQISHLIVHISLGNIKKNKSRNVLIYFPVSLELSKAAGTSFVIQTTINRRSVSKAETTVPFHSRHSQSVMDLPFSLTSLYFAFDFHTNDNINCIY